MLAVPKRAYDPGGSGSRTVVCVLTEEALVPISPEVLARARSAASWGGTKRLLAGAELVWGIVSVVIFIIGVRTAGGKYAARQEEAV